MPEQKDQENTERAKVLEKEALFATLIEKSTDENNGYLGHESVVDFLIRDAIDKVNHVLSNDAFSEKQLQGQIRVIATEMADVLMGFEEEDFYPVRNWNTPKALANYLRENFGVTETNNEQAVEHGVMLMLDEYLDLLEVLFVPGTLDEQIKNGLDEFVNRWTSIWMGTWLSLQVGV